MLYTGKPTFKLVIALNKLHLRTVLMLKNAAETYFLGLKKKNQHKHSLDITCSKENVLLFKGTPVCFSMFKVNSSSELLMSL